MLSNSAYALIAPFLPLELTAIGISLDYFGYIFSMYSVSVILGSPIIGYFLTKFKRRNFVQFGLLAMAIAMYGFAIAGVFNSTHAFLTIAFITRLI